MPSNSVAHNKITVRKKGKETGSKDELVTGQEVIKGMRNVLEEEMALLA